MRLLAFVWMTFFAAAALAGDAQTGDKKLDWSKPETVETFFNFMAGKYKWPASVKSTHASYSNTDKVAALGVLFEVDKPVKDDMVKTTYAAANIIGQAMAKGSPLDKTGVIFKTPDGSTALVALPPADLKKLGDESIKGPTADKAAINKMVGALIAKCNWKEVDALVKKMSDPKSTDEKKMDEKKMDGK